MNVKRQPTEKEKLFANHISDEGRTQNYKNNLAQKEQKHQVTNVNVGRGAAEWWLPGAGARGKERIVF